MAKPHYPACPPVLGPTEYENVVRCRHVKPAEKLAYLTEIAKCATKATAARKHEYIRKPKVRLGPLAERRLDPYEALGVLVSEVSFIKYNHQKFGKVLHKFKAMVDLFVSFHEKRMTGLTPTSRERMTAHSFTRAKVPMRTDGSIWLFRNPLGGTDAFDGIADQWIGHRLGLLIKSKGEIRLAFSFLAGRVDEPRLPTFYDVDWGFLSLWDWRGKTRPLSTTPPGLGGFEEVISLPSPDIRDHEPPVRRIVLANP